jgi:hypothetical protein
MEWKLLVSGAQTTLAVQQASKAVVASQETLLLDITGSAGFLTSPTITTYKFIQV